MIKLLFRNNYEYLVCINYVVFEGEKKKFFTFNAKKTLNLTSFFGVFTYNIAFF